MFVREIRYSTGVCFFVLFGVLSAPVASQPPGAKEDDQQTIIPKPANVALAAKVDFKKDLGLSYNSLNTLGRRIDAARRSHDPVSLANAANELAVAEKVSGKKADLTSAALIKEAAKLAQLRHQVSELQAVQEIARQTTADDELIAEMKKNLTDFDTQAKDETAALRSNQPPPYSSRTVIVHNNTTQNFDIWVNGYMKMTVPPGQSKWFVVEQKWNPTVIEAFGYTDQQTWGPSHIWGKFKTYTINLN
jgi:hypothetical protein